MTDVNKKLKILAGQTLVPFLKQTMGKSAIPLDSFCQSCTSFWGHVFNGTPLTCKLCAFERAHPGILEREDYDEKKRKQIVQRLLDDIIKKTKPQQKEQT